jgi:hypothetical protein
VYSRFSLKLFSLKRQHPVGPDGSYFISTLGFTQLEPFLTQPAGNGKKNLSACISRGSSSIAHKKLNSLIFDNSGYIVLCFKYAYKKCVPMKGEVQMNSLTNFWDALEYFAAVCLSLPHCGWGHCVLFP